MKLDGIILTGTSCAGKTTIAKRLLDSGENYVDARALTTRPKRNDDEGHYIYTDELNFENLRGLFLTSTVYRNYKYAITKSEVKRITDLGRLAILVISPESYGQMSTTDKERFLSFFIDADDSCLDERILKRDGGTVSREILLQRKIVFMQMNLIILFRIMILKLR